MRWFTVYCVNCYRSGLHFVIWTAKAVLQDLNGNPKTTLGRKGSQGHNWTLLIQTPTSYPPTRRGQINDAGEDIPVPCPPQRIMPDPTCHIGATLIRRMRDCNPGAWPLLLREDSTTTYEDQLSLIRGVLISSWPGGVGKELGSSFLSCVLCLLRRVPLSIPAEPRDPRSDRVPLMLKLETSSTDWGEGLIMHTTC